MTEIIPFLHQIGAHELEQIGNASLVIDMGGIISKVYANYHFHDKIDELKSQLHVPVLFLEIDEVDNEPFRHHKEKIGHLWSVASIAAKIIRVRGHVYTLCLAGQNRSGFMSALIMVHLGYSPEEAVEIIKRERDMALNNDILREYIYEMV